MRYSILILFLIALILSSARAQTPRSSTAGIPNVSFCNVLKNPQIYSGKVVRFRAVFTRGGEDWVAIYCPDCSTDVNLVMPEYDETLTR